MMYDDRKRDASPNPGETFSKVAECLYRNDSSRTYYGLVKRGGKQFRRSLKTTDRKLAERRLADLRVKVGRLSQTKEGRTLSFEDLAGRWLASVRGGMKPSSARRREVCIHQLTPHFRGVMARNLTTENCNNWVLKRGNSLSAQSFNIERETLIHILEYARQSGLLLDNPALAIKRRRLSKGKPVIPSREEFRQLVSTIRRADSRAQGAGDLVELLAYSGMRLGEATALTWGDIDSERGTFLVTGGEVGTKNRENRIVPLFPAMRDLLARVRGNGEPAPTDRVIRITSAKKAMATACRNAKLPHFHHHCLRHYFCSNAIEAGIDFKVIAGWLGHKDGGYLVAKTYGHLRDVHSFEMAKRMTFSAIEKPPENVVPLPANATIR